MEYMNLLYLLCNGFAFFALGFFIGFFFGGKGKGAVLKREAEEVNLSREYKNFLTYDGTAQ